MPNLFRKLSPILILCLAVLLFGFGLMVMTYLILFGAIVGTVLYVANWIQARFLTPPKKKQAARPMQGRVIDSDDWHRVP